MSLTGLDSLRPARTLVDQTYDAVLDAICDGTLKPGERLTQDEVAARLNVSRQPVMHALAMLRAQGFVIEVGRRGLQVAPVDRKLFEAIYQFRSAVEPLAVRLATARLTPEAITQARSIVARGRDMVVAGNQKAVLEADVAFHSFIYELSDNPIIVDTMRLNWQHLRRAMGEVLRFPGMSIAVWKEHTEILEAMIRGDAEEAARLMEKHLVEARLRITSEAGEGVTAGNG